MPSAAQIRANRANSARSTGPKTAQGRAASSANSLRHGLTAEQIVVGDEDGAEYEALVADLVASHQPANTAESILVGQIAENYWRLQRARKIETGFWERQMSENNAMVLRPGNERFQHDTPHQQSADIFGWNDRGMFDRLMRYEAFIERSYYRAIKQLEHLQLIRRKAEKPIGFVSQKLAPANVIAMRPLSAPAAMAASQPQQPASDIQPLGITSETTTPDGEFHSSGGHQGHAA